MFRAFVRQSTPTDVLSTNHVPTMRAAVLQDYHHVWLSKNPNRTPHWLAERLKEGFDIHHLDGDHSNNSEENLVLIDHWDHFALHGGPGLRDRLIYRFGRRSVDRLAATSVQDEHDPHYSDQSSDPEVSNDLRIASLKSLRKRLNMRQPRFAQLFGIEAETISSYERGRRDIPEPVWKLIRIIEVLGF